MNMKTAYKELRSLKKETRWLMVRKRYKLAKMVMRQAAEVFTEAIAEEHNKEIYELLVLIDNVYSARLITEETKNSLHTIRKAGNKAVHDRDNNADDAYKCYEIMKTEIKKFRKYYSK